MNIITSLKRQQKNYILCDSLLFNISIKAQSDLNLHCLLKRLQNISKDDKNRQLFVICALRVNKCELSV